MQRYRINFQPNAKKFTISQNYLMTLKWVGIFQFVTCYQYRLASVKHMNIQSIILIQTGSSITEAEHQPISSSPNSGSKAGSTPPQANTPPPSLNSSFNIGNTNTPNRNLLGLTPSDEVVFDVNNAGENNGLQAKLQIKNNSNKMVVFKVNKKMNSMWKANITF